MLVTGLAFVGGGIVARRRRPDNPIGLVMIAAGFAWFARSLEWAEHPVLFTAGIAVQGLYLGFVSHMLLSFPAGRLGSWIDRGVVGAAYVVVTAGQGLWMLFADFLHPLEGSRVNPLFCVSCPDNLLRVQRNDELAFALVRTQWAVGAAIAAAVFVILAVRWLRATPAWRRSTAPVLWAGGAVTAVVLFWVVNQQLLRPLGELPDWVLLAIFPSVPLAFLVGLLLSRLDHAAVARLVVQLDVTHAPAELQAALARALHDPRLELVQWLPEEERYVDARGRSRDLDFLPPRRVVTRIDRGGEHIAALIHDPSLAENRALLDAACAAVGLALENEHLRGTALASASAGHDPADHERDVQALIDVGLEAQAVRSVPDLVEAYVRSGRSDEAEALLRSFEDEVARSHDPGPRAAAARCRGLLAEEFEPHFEEALREHVQRPVPFEQARTELCYGERLRRARRRVEARGRLRSALRVFEELGVEDWAERARGELAATGERIRRRDPAAGEELTPQEAHVALLVARGATNREVGAALFLSPKTIEAHLGRIYRKLGVRSRTELAHMLATESGGASEPPERGGLPGTRRAAAF